MRLVLFGTGPFAVPTYESLTKQHEIAAIVTRPISDSGKRRKTSENPVRDLGEALGLNILDPPNCNDPEFVSELAATSSDLFVVCDYGQILSRDCLAASRLGGINLHGSLLPKYRGAAPIQWCVYNGDAVTGVTVIHMTAKLDGGPCLVKESLEIEPDETAEDLEPRLSTLGISAVDKAIALLDDWDSESPIGEIQDAGLATKAPRLKKSDGEIDFHRSARQLHNQVRAFQPWPKSFTHWKPENKSPLRLIINRTTIVADDLVDNSLASDAEPGAVVFCDSKQLWIATGKGIISILELQPSGKRAMQIADFLRGHQPAVGDIFG